MHRVPNAGRFGEHILRALNKIRKPGTAEEITGLSTPLLMLLIMLITTNTKIMGRWVNTRQLNVLGWLTTAAIFTASLGLLVTWLR
jgi:Mn2+/Fe2+ NRAMP family transporter